MRLQNLLKILFLFLFASVASAQIYSTGFTTADENPLSLSGEWTTPTGESLWPMKVVSNAIQSATLTLWNPGCGLRDAAYARTNGIRVKVKISQFTNQASAAYGIMMRMESKSNGSYGYMLHVLQNSATSATFTIKSVYGWHAWTSVTIDAQTTTRTVAAGDSLIVNCLGDASGTMNVYHNTTLILTGTDITYNPTASTGAYYGILSQTQTTPVIFDDFSIDSVTVVSAATVDTVAPTVRSVSISPATLDTSTLASFIVNAYDSLSPSTGLDSVQVDTNDVAYWKYKYGTTKDTTVTSPTVKFGAGAKTYRARVVDDSGNVTTTAAKNFIVGVGTVDSGTTSALPIIAYYPIWGIPHMWMDSIDYDAVTHIIHFATGVSQTPPHFLPVVDPIDSALLLHSSNWIEGGYPAARKLIDSAHAHGTKVLLSVAAVGGQALIDMNYVAADSTRMQALVNSTVAFLVRHGYDGVDLNWEFPGPAERDDVTRACRLFRQALDAWPTPGTLVMTAYPIVGAAAADRWCDVAALDTLLDYLMPEMYGLGLHQSNTILGHSVALYPSGSCISSPVRALTFTDSAWQSVNVAMLKGYSGIGFSKNKLVGGLGLGSMWLYHNATYCQTGASFDYSVGNNYAKVLTTYGSWPTFYDSAAHMSYKQNGTDFITYEDSASLTDKVRWIKDNGYGGVMLYDLAGGYISQEATWGGIPSYTGDRNVLIHAVQAAIGSATSTPPPGPPTLLLPTNAATSQATFNLLLKWSKPTLASTYQIQLSTASNFSSLIPTPAVVDTFYTITGNLGQNATYYWRVRAGNPSYGQYSSTFSFTTAQVFADTPAVPTLRLPANGATDQITSPVITWGRGASDTVNVTAYALQVATDTNMTNLIVNTSTLVDTSYTVFNQAAGAKLYWRVKAYNFAIPSAYSSIRSFTITSTVSVFGYKTPLIFDPALKGGAGQWTSDPQTFTYKRKILQAQLPASGSIPSELAVDFIGGYVDALGVHLYQTDVTQLSNAQIVTQWDAQVNNLQRRHTFAGGITVTGTATGLVKKVRVGATTLPDSVNLIAGTNITITPSNDSITIASTGSGTNLGDTTVDTAKADLFFNDSGADDVRLEFGRAGSAQSYFRNSEVGNSYWESITSNLFIKNGNTGASWKQSTSGSSTFYTPTLGKQFKFLYGQTAENDSLFAIYDSGATHFSFGVANTGDVSVNGRSAGIDTFTTTAVADTVLISGATATDIYTWDYTALPNTNDILRWYVAKADTVIFNRAASGTSGIGYSWIRVKKIP